MRLDLDDGGCDPDYRRSIALRRVHGSTGECARGHINFFKNAVLTMPYDTTLRLSANDPYIVDICTPCTEVSAPFRCIEGSLPRCQYRLCSIVVTTKQECSDVEQEARSGDETPRSNQIAESRRGDRHLTNRGVLFEWPH